jgi:hypothetical protein
MASARFDPSNQMLKSQLLDILQVHGNASIEKLKTSGGLNDGTWLVRGSRNKDLILKLVKAGRQEGEKLLKLSRKYPGLVHDEMLSFPLQVIHCLGTDGVKRYDLVVMQRAQGTSLGEFIGKQFYGGKTKDVMRVLRKVGALLSDFHMHYAESQHGDFQPSNIFYNESTDKVTFIDVADIGSQNADRQHFLKSLKILSQAYGAQFLAEATQAFERGYGR